VGLQINEAPFLGATSTDKLMVAVPVTVEPGISLPGRGGVRIEDTVVVHADRVDASERAAFRAVNDLPLPGWLYPAIWLLMQGGNIGAVPVVALLAVATRRLRMALDMALAGGAITILGYTVNLASGASIAVAGGAVLNGRGGITYGNGGSLSITAGREPGFSATLGGSLTLAATLQGYSGAKAGTLKVTGSALQIGGTAGDPRLTVVEPETFAAHGFGNISLSGVGLAGSSSVPAIPGLLVAGGGLAHQVDAEEWHRVIAVNLTSTFMLMRAGTRAMMEAALEGLTRPDGTRALLIAVTQLTSTSEKVASVMTIAIVPRVVGER